MKNSLMKKECFCLDLSEKNEFTIGDSAESYKNRVIRPLCSEERFEYSDGNKYCLLHYPDENKFNKYEEFEKIFGEKINNLKKEIGDLEKTLKHYRFHGYWFPKKSKELLEQCFKNFTFEDDVSFRYATFNCKVDFSSTQFKNKVSFWGAKFCDTADFFFVRFPAETTFTHAIFEKDVSFRRCKFNGETFFYETEFRTSANFSDAIFSDYVIFRGKVKKDEKAGLPDIKLEDCRFEKPEQTIFQSVKLHPSYFISHQPRKFVFVDVEWKNANGYHDKVKKELDKIADLPNRNRLMNVTCLQLAANAEENSRYEEASNFRRMAFEIEYLERKENRKKWLKIILSRYKSDLSGNVPTLNFWRSFDLLPWLYRRTSHFGESWWRALRVFIYIWLFFAILYSSPWHLLCNGWGEDKGKCDYLIATFEKEKKIATFEKEKKLEFPQTLAYSFEVMTLQKPEPKPENPLAHFIVGIETVLGPLQLALLALAIRRKFMR